MIRLPQRLDSSWLRKRSVPLQSDKALRTAIGILGIALAPAVWFFAKVFGDITLLSSISAYYHTNSEDFFVGVLFLVGVFQISYRGHQVIDNVFTWITGILAIVIGAFPCAPPKGLHVSSLLDGNPPIGIFGYAASVSNKVHFAAAVTFFILISIYVLVFFRRTEKTPSIQKKRKNLVFFLCGYGMIAILLAIFIVYLFLGEDFFRHPGVLFFPEFVLLLLFGVAWVVKANFIPGCIDPE